MVKNLCINIVPSLNKTWNVFSFLFMFFCPEKNSHICYVSHYNKMVVGVWEHVRIVVQNGGPFGYPYQIIGIMYSISWNLLYSFVKKVYNNN